MTEKTCHMTAAGSQWIWLHTYDGKSLAIRGEDVTAVLPTLRLGQPGADIICGSMRYSVKEHLTEVMEQLDSIFADECSESCGSSLSDDCCSASVSRSESELAADLRESEDQIERLVGKLAKASAELVEVKKERDQLLESVKRLTSAVQQGNAAGYQGGALYSWNLPKIDDGPNVSQTYPGPRV